MEFDSLVKLHKPVWNNYVSVLCVSRYAGCVFVRAVLSWRPITWHSLLRLQPTFLNISLIIIYYVVNLKLDISVGLLHAKMYHQDRQREIAIYWFSHTTTCINPLSLDKQDILRRLSSTIPLRHPRDNGS